MVKMMKLFFELISLWIIVIMVLVVCYEEIKGED